MNVIFSILSVKNCFNFNFSHTNEFKKNLPKMSDNVYSKIFVSELTCQVGGSRPNLVLRKVLNVLELPCYLQPCPKPSDTVDSRHHRLLDHLSLYEALQHFCNLIQNVKKPLKILNFLKLNITVFFTIPLFLSLRP